VTPEPEEVVVDTAPDDEYSPKESVVVGSRMAGPRRPLVVIVSGFEGGSLVTVVLM
jgi:hypothetical protein